MQIVNLLGWWALRWLFFSQTFSQNLKVFYTQTQAFLKQERFILYMKKVVRSNGTHKIWLYPALSCPVCLCRLLPSGLVSSDSVALWVSANSSQSPWSLGSFSCSLQWGLVLFYLMITYSKQSDRESVTSSEKLDSKVSKCKFLLPVAVLCDANDGANAANLPLPLLMLWVDKLIASVSSALTIFANKWKLHEKYSSEVEEDSGKLCSLLDR